MSETVCLLLLLPFVGLLWIAFYNLSVPDPFGFPFFYWYQLVWVPITAFRAHRGRAERRYRGGGGGSCVSGERMDFATGAMLPVA